jgi:hypothetical protein
VTIHRLDEVLDAKPPRPPAPAVSGVRSIPRPCSCTWKPHFSTIPAAWTLTETDRFCPVHGEVGS